MREIIMWEEGSKVVEECIEKTRMILDGYQPGALLTSEDYIKYYEYPFYLFVLCANCYILYFLYVNCLYLPTNAIMNIT